MHMTLLFENVNDFVLTEEIIFLHRIQLYWQTICVLSVTNQADLVLYYAQL